jgi:hypothetical protein
MLALMPDWHLSQTEDADSGWDLDPVVDVEVDENR